MLRNVFGIVLLAIYLVAPVIAAGQDVPGGKWWYNPKIQKNLDLNKKEIGKLDKLFAKSRRKLIKLKSEVEHDQFELDELLDQDKVDNAKVKKQFQKLEKSRNKLANERLDFVIGVRNILGPDRFQQLKSNYRKWQ